MSKKEIECDHREPGQKDRRPIGALLVVAAASAVVLQSVGYATAPVVIR